MSHVSRFPALATSLTLLGTLGARAQSVAPASLTVQVSKPGAAVNKNMYGLFFEDINFAADGGLYPELVKNKSFETDARLMGWKAPPTSTPTPCAMSSPSRPATRTTCA